MFVERADDPSRIAAAIPPIGVNTSTKYAFEYCRSSERLCAQPRGGIERDGWTPPDGSGNPFAVRLAPSKPFGSDENRVLNTRSVFSKVGS